MHNVTFNICDVVDSLGRKSVEDNVSPVVVALSGGPSKRTKLNTKKANITFSTLVVKDFVEEVTSLGKSLVKAMKELA